MIRIVFVCLGNICRSPMAEGVFKHLVEEEDLTDEFFIDSAGTSGWHVGELADANMRKTAKNHGIALTSRSRKFIAEDLNQFDYIVAMDKSNYQNILSLATQEEIASKVVLLREFDNEKSRSDVFDPYGMNIDGFERCYQIIRESTANLLSYLKEEHSL